MTPVNQARGAAAAVGADIPVSPLDEPNEEEREDDGMICGSCAEDDEQAEGEEVPDVRAKTAPRGPSKSEREAHEATHMPYRSWCAHCVRGRGIASPHVEKKDDDERKEMRRPVVSMDYFFMNKEDEDKATMIAVKEEKHGCVHASIVPGKGDQVEWVSSHVARFCNKLGFKEITMKSDTEPAILALRDSVSRKCNAEVITEDTPVGDHQSNGGIENAVKNIRGMIRTVRDAVEESMGEPIKDDSVLMPWLVEHAANLVTVCQVGRDGRTPHERLRGKRPPQALVPFGEKVLFQSLRQDRRANKAEPRFDYGVWAGIRIGGADVYILTPEGAVRARNVRRLPEAERWDMDFVSKVRVVPWDMAEGVQSDPIGAGRSLDEPRAPPPPPPLVDEPPAMRRFRINKEDIVKFGTTANCPGCTAIRWGKRQQGHSEACRARIEEQLSKTKEGAERIEKRKHAIDETIVKYMEEQDAKRQRAPQDQPAVASQPMDEGEPPPRGSKRQSELPTEEIQWDLETERAMEESRRMLLESGQEAPQVDPTSASSTAANPGTSTGTAASGGGTAGTAASGGGMDVSAIVDQPTLTNGAIVEVYSPPRVADIAEQRGMPKGASLDLTNGWNFNLPKHRLDAARLIQKMKPSLVIASPMCTPFSSLQYLNQKRPEEIRAMELEYGKNHVEYAIKLLEMQRELGGHVLFEHPRSATSWNLPCMRDFISKHELRLVTADQCMYGLKSIDPAGEAHAKKPTMFVTSSGRIAERLSRRCDGTHRHVQLLGGRAGPAAQYPRGLCEAICDGLRDQLCDDAEAILCNIETSSGARFYDNLTGKQLDPKLVQAAREEEIMYYKGMKVYVKMNREEAVEKYGVKPIQVRWVDTDKAHPGEEPHYRSRLVAKEIRKDERPELFAGTPPVETVKILCGRLASKRRGWGMLHIDVSRAYFHADAVRPVLIELPAEDYEDGDEYKVGVLQKSMYGTRDAALNWEREYCKTLAELGLDRGKSSGNLFKNMEQKTSLTVHGDDLVAVGPVKVLQGIAAGMESKYPVKVSIMSDMPGHVRELRVLGRRIRWTTEGVVYEHDERHVQRILEQLELGQATPVRTPAVKQEQVHPEEDTPLRPGDATAYRALAARMNYLAVDRPDVAFATKEICKCMSNPMQRDWEKIKRVARYLIKVPDLAALFPWGSGEDPVLKVYTDSDWAGDRETRKSTSAGCAMWCGGTIKHWTKQQKVIAKSSAEAELYAATLAASEAKGLVATMRDLGIEVKIRLHIDAKATLFILHRLGPGKMKHVEVHHLWLQHEVRAKKIELVKIGTEDNPADLGTKALDEARMVRHWEFMNHFQPTR